jgi:TRAP-type transport system periplasmic protein
MSAKCPRVAVIMLFVLGLLAGPAAADYKPEFTLSLVITQDSAWGRAAVRFADVVRHRTQGRINIRNYFDGQLFKGKQTTESRS